MTISERLISLDIFRGITIAAMILVNFPGSWTANYRMLEHAEWVGTTPTDFIFPFFLFIVGISITLSFQKQIERGKTRQQILKKSVVRALKLFGVGLLLRLLPTLDFSRFELPGVLQRISLVFLACAALYLFTGWRTQLVVGISILIAYWLALMLIPIPGFGGGVLEPGKNLANWIDKVVFPPYLINQRGYDSEGILSTIPAIVTGISGLLAGKMLLHQTDRKKLVQQLVVAGAVLLAVGYLWGVYFPIIKKIWTSSFMLVTAGWAFLVYALLFFLVEIKNWKTGTFPWIVFGSNAIAIYVLADIFETFFIRTGIRDNTVLWMQNYGLYIKTASLIWAIFSVLVCWIAGWILYKKKIFIKL
jgi:predicted acyltransferase